MAERLQESGWVPSAHCAKVEAERDRYREALERLLEADPPTDLSSGRDWRVARAHAREVLDA